MGKIINNCFGCANRNPIGLKLKFTFKKNIAITEWEPTKNYEGFPDVLHGGIIATILDEVMAKVIENSGIWAVTIEIKVKYLKKIEIGKKIIAFGKLIEKRKKILTLEAEICNDKGEIAALGRGKYYAMKNILPNYIRPKKI